MATQTPNLNLTKPMGTDYVRIGDFNDNADKLDVSIGDLGQLTTDAKANLVLAINEAMLRGGENAPYIDDTTGNWMMWDVETAQYVDTGVHAEGPQGEAAGFAAPTASAATLEPGAEATVEVSSSGPDTAKVFGFEFGIPKGDKGEQGATGHGVIILGTYATLEALQAAVTSPAPGDMYNVGMAAPYDVYMWDGVAMAWANQGAIKGDPGEGVPAGGLAGQILAKATGTDYDTAWQTPPDTVTYTTQAKTANEQAQARSNIGAAGAEHVHGSISNAGAIGATPDLPVFTGADGVLEVKSREEAIVSLGAGVMRNMLDNWDFRNLVNQRGAASYPASAGWAYGLDRWKAYNATVTVNTGHINVVSDEASALHKRFTQVTENSGKTGETYTASMRIRVNSVSGDVYLRLNSAHNEISATMLVQSTEWQTITVTTTLSADYPNLGIEILATNNANSQFNIDIERAKLEPGPVSTLANDPPADYGEELNKCLRYYRTLPLCNPVGIGAAVTQIRTTLTFEGAPMYAEPTPAITAANAVIGSTWTAASSTAKVNASNRHITIGLNYASGITANTTYMLQLAMSLSAEL